MLIAAMRRRKLEKLAITAPHLDGLFLLCISVLQVLPVLLQHRSSEWNVDLNFKAN